MPLIVQKAHHILSLLAVFCSHNAKMIESMNPPANRDRTNENFLRATKNIMRRGDEMSRRYGADIYIVLRRKGRYYDYCSTQDTSFPTLPREIVRIPEPEACLMLTVNRIKLTLCQLEERRQALSGKNTGRPRMRRLRNCAIATC